MVELSILARGLVIISWVEQASWLVYLSAAFP